MYDSGICRPSVRQHFQNIFSSKTTGPIEQKFHMETPMDPRAKVCSNGPVHMTKMAAMPKPFKNLLQNQKADDLGTWYVALGMWGLPSLVK